jgi:hypothetical protein
VISPLIYKNVGYDPVKGFAPVALLGITSNLMIVNPAVAAKSVQELTALARANPGKLNFIGRHRHATASDRRDVQAAAQARHRACALQGRRTVGRGGGVGRNAILVREPRGVAAAGAGRHGARLGGDE